RARRAVPEARRQGPPRGTRRRGPVGLVVGAVSDGGRPADEGRLTASRDAPVGGQAVLGGVMMRGVSTWAVAVRKPLAEAEGSPSDRPADPVHVPEALGPIKVESFPLVSWTARRRVWRLPVIRGVVALGESLAIGLRALGISANAQMPEDEQEISSGVWAGTV